MTPLQAQIVLQTAELRLTQGQPKQPYLEVIFRVMEYADPDMKRDFINAIVEVWREMEKSAAPVGQDDFDAFKFHVD